MPYTETLNEATERVIGDLEKDLNHLKSVYDKETRMMYGKFLIGRCQALSSLFLHLPNAESVLKRINDMRQEANEVTYKGAIS